MAPQAASATLARPPPLQVTVCGLDYHHFRHRIPPARVRLLEVRGDLKLESVTVF